MKTPLLFVIASLHMTLSSAQDTITVPTEISAVTVFTKSAQVHRTGNAKIPSGTSVLLLRGLSPDMDPKSIQIKGTEEMIVLSFTHQLKQPTAIHPDLRTDSLNRAITALDLMTKTLDTRLDVINRKDVLLTDNTNLFNNRANVSIEQLEKALVLYENTLMKSETEKMLIKLRLDSIQQVRLDLQQRIQKLRGTSKTSTSQLTIVVRSAVSATVPVEISYIVKTAGWLPRYDIRAKDITQPVSLIYKGDVYQQTGEVWKNVKLKFSTGSPYERQTAPELVKWDLNFARHTTVRRIGPSNLSYGGTMLSGSVRDADTKEPLIYANVVVSGHTVGTMTDLDGNFSLILPAGARTLDISYTGYAQQSVPITGDFVDVRMVSGPMLETAVVTGYKAGAGERDMSYSTTTAQKQSYVQHSIVYENQVTVEFELENAATIPSEGKIITLDLKEYQLVADYTYECAPKADLNAYLVATITDWEECHLLEGEANLYFNNTYIGKTILNPDLISDTLEISLGRDNDLVVKRIKAEEFTKKTFLGTNTVVEKSFRISVRNKKLSPVKMIITDQIPVSVQDAITVTPVQLSGGLLNVEDGSVRWNLDLAAGESRELLMNYMVKHPTRERVGLE